MEKHKNHFMKNNNQKKNNFKNDIPKNDIHKNDIPKNDRWNTIKRDIEDIEYNNRLDMEDREERKERNNPFRKSYQNQNQSHYYSKFIQFTKLPEKKPEKKLEFNLEKMQEDFPQLG